VLAVIGDMELMKSEGKEGLGRILAKTIPLTQACGLWMLRQKNKTPDTGPRHIKRGTPLEYHRYLKIF
jgi:hypothetical protein